MLIVRLPAPDSTPRLQMCHATACWMTCGSVEGLEVHTNEGGVTKYRGSARLLITPAGYMGGAFWCVRGSVHVSVGE